MMRCQTNAVISVPSMVVAIAPISRWAGNAQYSTSAPAASSSITIHTRTVIVRAWRRTVDAMNSTHISSVSTRHAARAPSVNGMGSPWGNPARNPATNDSAANPMEQATRKRRLAAPERTKLK